MNRRRFGDYEHKKVNRILELVHSDPCGTMSMDSLGGARYFLFLVYDLIRFTFVVISKRKPDTLEEFKASVNLMGDQNNEKFGRCALITAPST